MDVRARDVAREVVIEPEEGTVGDAGWIEGLLARIREADSLAFDTEGE
jgi:hypothetical protein